MSALCLDFGVHFPSDRRIEKLASNLEAILQVNAYGYQVACKILASFSIHLQDFCKLFDSSCKNTCKMNRKACKMNRKACKNLASFSIQMLGKGANAERVQSFAAVTLSYL